MALLGGVYLLVTLALILAFALCLLLWGLNCLRHVIPNKGDEPLIILSKSVLGIAKFIAFFSFLAFVVLSFVTAGVEIIVYGGIRNPILTAIIRALLWTASHMTQFASRLFQNSQYGGYIPS